MRYTSLLSFFGALALSAIPAAVGFAQSYPVVDENGEPTGEYINFDDLSDVSPDATDEFGEINAQLDGGFGVTADESALFLDLDQGERACPVNELRALYEAASSNYEYMDAVLIEKEVIQICTDAAISYEALVRQEQQIYNAWVEYREKRNLPIEVSISDADLGILEGVRRRPNEAPSAGEIVQEEVITEIVQSPADGENSEEALNDVVADVIEIITEENICPDPRPASLFVMRGSISVSDNVYALIEQANPPEETEFADSSAGGLSFAAPSLTGVSFTVTIGEPLPGGVIVEEIVPKKGTAVLSDCAGNYLIEM